MHILLIHQAFAALDEPGGTRHMELALFLTQRGHHVTVIASPVSYLTGEASSRPARQQIELPTGSQGSLTIFRTYTYPALHRSFVHRVFSFLSFMFSSFWRGLRLGPFDVVWGTSPPIFQAGTAWLLARWHRARFLLEIRDLWPAFAVQAGVLRNRLLIWAAETFERFLYHRADLVMINSPGFEEHVRGGGARRVALVPNGADAAMFDPHSRGGDFRKTHGLPADGFIALYAGAHGLSNDLEVVLEAAAHLRDQPGIHLVLLGDGKEKPALRQRASELDLRNLSFIDSLPKTGMSDALAASDACIAILKPVPLYRTVYPNKVFDYLAAGRPVVLAMQGVIRKLVEEAGCGIPVEPGDPAGLAAAIRSLAADRELCAEMSQNGRAYLERHLDRPVLAGQFEQLLQHLAGTSPARETSEA